ncbi:MAG TPA: VOC family protein [Nocardioidaceae bacterium]|nr:VOC family protein [Nocardioidaceae bacterium]
MSDVRQVQVTFDCGDPRVLEAFWCQVLGYVEDPPPAGHPTWEEALEAFGVPREEWNSRAACHDPGGVGPRLFFQRVPEGKTVKNRVHLDVRAAPGLRGEDRMTALEAEADRLVALGATRRQRFDPDSSPGELGFIVMQDPEGNEFCLD